MSQQIELYKIVVEEYRFQVNLNWDRNKFYVLLNSGLIATSCGLLRIPGFGFAQFLTAPLFILGMLAAYLGYQTLIKGIEYRRRITIKKAQLEQEIGIPLIDTTQGMREVLQMNSEELAAYVTKPPRIGTINYFLAALFIFLIVLNAISFAATFVTALLSVISNTFTSFTQQSAISLSSLYLAG